MLFSIEAVITKSIEILLGDMPDKPSDEFKGRDGLILAHSILETVVPERDELPIIIGNTGLGYGRSANIAGDVIGDSFGGVEIRSGSMDIEAILVVGVHLIFQSSESAFAEYFFKHVEKCSLPFFPQHDIGKEREGLPWRKVATGPFGYNHMNMRVPFEVAAEGMKGTDDARSKGFLAIE